MNNKNEYDFLRELTNADDRRINRVANKYPAPDKSALKRINALCEEKLKMKDNNIINNPENSSRENVEVISNIPWYRRPAFTAAACFVVLAGVTGGVMALFSGRNELNSSDDIPPLSNIETSVAESTTDETTEDTTDTTTSEELSETTVEPTAEINIAIETTEQSDESIEMPDLIGKPYDSSKEEYKDSFQLIADNYEYSNEYEEGTIIEQSVNAGTAVNKGSVVKVTVCKGILYGIDEDDVPDENAINEIMDALYLAEAFMSNGLELDCDMDDNFTDESGQLYVKVTESGFNTMADVADFINKYMTENMINSRYKALTDRNSGKFIEKENGLYIRYAPKASIFIRNDNNPMAILGVKTDDTSVTEFQILYDNFGANEALTIHLKDLDGYNWQIDRLEELKAYNEE